MTRLDDRLKHDLGRAGRPADPAGVYEDLIRRRERKRVTRRFGSAALVIVVVLGSLGGLLALLEIFGARSSTPGDGAAGTNGEIAYLSPTNGDRMDVRLFDPVSGVDRILLTVDSAHVGLDWSPDGESLAYSEFQQGIFLLDVTTGASRRVAGPGAWSPSWSPDGSKIVYAVDREGEPDAIEIANADGSGARVVLDMPNLGSVDWSPDGSRLVFAGPGPPGASQGWDIYVANVDGNLNLTNLTNSDPVDLDPQWSPDGSDILFRSRRDPPPGWTTGEAPDELYLMAPDGSSVRRLTNDDARDQSPSWAPDGSLIVFDRWPGPDVGQHLFTIRPDGTELTDLGIGGYDPAWRPVPGGAPAPTGPFGPQPSAEPPTGSEGPVGSGLGSIAVTWYHGFPDPEQALALLSTDDGSATPLTSGGRGDGNPAWSPDGSTIAFWRIPAEAPPGAGIYTVPATGGEPRLLFETDLSIWSISWSPAGDRIAFVGVTAVGGTELDMPEAIYTIASDGSDLRQITSEGQVVDVAWSPDGTRLAMTRQYAVGERKLGTDIYVLDLATAEEQRLTNDGSASSPSWSPDGTRIAFSSSETRDPREGDLYVMDADGSNRVRLTTTPEIEDDPAWAPDGSAIAVTRLALGDPRDCDLVLVAPDSSAERILFDGPLDGWCPITTAWQPVG